MYKKTFHGGVHPYDGKEFARDIPFQTWLPKGDLVFHLNQHIGKPAKPLVQKGDSVLAGQIIAEDVYKRQEHDRSVSSGSLWKDNCQLQP